MKKNRATLPEELEDAARPDEDRTTRERNAALAVALLALVVAGLLLAIVLGGTDAIRP